MRARLVLMLLSLSWVLSACVGSSDGGGQGDLLGDEGGGADVGGEDIAEDLPPGDLQEPDHIDSDAIEVAVDQTDPDQGLELPDEEDFVEEVEWLCEPGTAGEDCAACFPGEYCAGGSASPVACGQGQWDHDQDPATPCQPHSDCAAGTFVNGNGSATTDRTCEDCPDGSFTDGLNSAVCQPWGTCTAGQYIATAGSPSSNRLCEACAEGSFSAGSDWEECLAWRDCDAGMYIYQEGTDKVDRICEDCAAGSFTSEANMLMCQAWQECVPGEYVVELASATQDHICEPCAAGTYSIENQSGTCLSWTNCLPGEYVQARGSESQDRLCADCGSSETSFVNNQLYCDKEYYTFVDAGTFMMGDPDALSADDNFMHEVEITRPIAVSKYETLGLSWLILMNNNPSSYNDIGTPVTDVSWYDALAFANAFSESEGLELCYDLSACLGTPGEEDYICPDDLEFDFDCNGYRLPTEAEWEYFTRAGSTTEYWSGDGAYDLDSVGWFTENASAVHAAGLKDANDWGLHDVHGNISEWVWDWYGYHYPTGAQVDPTGGDNAIDQRVHRGGSFISWYDSCQSDFRSHKNPSTRAWNLGFRLVRTIDVDE